MTNLDVFFLTIIIFKLSERVINLKSLRFLKIFPPVLLTGILMILWLKIFNKSYYEYKISTSLLTFLLIPATISLGYPLYKNKNILLKYKRIIYSAFFVAIFCAVILTFLTGFCCHINSALTISMLPKSVTAPIAIEISKSAGGIKELTACVVVLTGVFGAIFGHLILKLFKVKNDIAIGLALGATSHVIATAKCVETGRAKQVTMSSLALVVVGILTAIIIPIFLKLF